MGSSPIGHPRFFKRFLIALIFASASASAETVSFSVCFEHGCANSVSITLGPSDWEIIRKLFADVKDAEVERERIAQSIAALETLASGNIGAADRGGTGLAYPGQMDCIDESTNSTNYLKLLAHDGLLRWHRVEERATRGWLIFGWPHTTAVISEQATGERFAVDSWFYDNGIAPVIVPLEEWRRGWNP
ncbi:MAG: hypothetical protein ACREV9_11455 [Burkholderiales bacterium]